MSATDFLCVQLIGNGLAAWLIRSQLRGKCDRVLRLLLFIGATSYSFDYVANDLQVWHFDGAWDLRILRNPLENTLFAVTMAFQLLLIYLVTANRTATNNRK